MVGAKTGPLHRGIDGYYDEHRHWQYWSFTVDDDLRVMPITVPEIQLQTHRQLCECDGCRMFPQEWLRQYKRAYRAKERPRSRELAAQRLADANLREQQGDAHQDH